MLAFGVSPNDPLLERAVFHVLDALNDCEPCARRNAVVLALVINWAHHQVNEHGAPTLAAAIDGLSMLAKREAEHFVRAELRAPGQKPPGAMH